MSRNFRAREIQVPLQCVEHEARKFVSPFVELGFAPIAVQSNGIAEVFGKNLTVRAFTDHNISQAASSCGIVNTAVSAPSRVREAEKHFAVIPVVGAIIPSLAGV